MDALGNLGIDGFSVLLYLVNFGILLYLLKRFAYTPLMKAVDDRKKRITEDVELANKIRETLAKERADEAEVRRARLDELSETVTQTKRVAKQEAKRVISEAEEQREAIIANANATADQTIAATVDGAEKEILDRVRQMVAHVLKEGVPQDVVDASVKQSWKEISKQV